MDKSGERLHPCPVCGYLVFDEPPGSYDICPICFWEDDLAQLRYVELGGGANRPSLVQAQKNFFEFEAVEMRFRKNVRAPLASDRRSHDWVPIDPARHIIEHPIAGVDSGSSYPNDSTALYYWRRVRQ
jgi:hypothetical protein